MNNSHHFLTRLSVLLLVLLTTCGCALFNPHYHKSRNATEPATPPKATDTATSMADAVKYADQTISDYRKGMGYQAYLSSFTGLALIPLTAVTIALGIQGGHTNAVTNLALGGAAIYGGSSWLSSPNRSLIYAEGIRAVNCAKMVMLPYSVDHAWMKEFNSALAQLSYFYGQLTIELAELRGLIKSDTGSPDNDKQSAEAIAESATDLLKRSAVTHKNGFSLKRGLELAGQTLMFTVDRIDGEVDKALISTVPNLSALPGIIASLNPSADMFRQSHLPTESKNGNAITIKQVTNLSEKVKAFKATYISLAYAESIVRGDVENFDQTIPASVLQQCGVSQNDIIKPILILPDFKVTIIAGKSTTVFLSGGSGKYVTAKTDDIEGLKVSQPVPLGETVRIETPTGINQNTDTKVLVKDTAGQTAFIEILIVPEPSKK